MHLDDRSSVERQMRDLPRFQHRPDRWRDAKSEAKSEGKSEAKSEGKVKPKVKRNVKPWIRQIGHGNEKPAHNQRSWL